MKEMTYRDVEGVLYNLPSQKVRINNLKLELEEVQEIIGIRGASDNERAGSSTYAFSSTVENEVIERDRKLADQIIQLSRTINQKEREVRRVENILGLLTDYEMRIIEMKYFKRYSIGRICEILEVTEDGFNKRKKRLVKERLIPLFS